MLRLIRQLIILTFLFSHFSLAAYAINAQIKVTDSSIEQAVLVHINEYRQKHSLRPLKMDVRISKTARNHSKEMAHHSRPFGHQYFLSRIKHLHVQIKNSGAGAENVAFNYKDAQDVVKNWLRSPGHKRNIDGNYDLTGIGVARDTRGRIYFTQIFLRTNTQPQRVTKRLVSHATHFFNHSIFKRGISLLQN